MKKQVLILVRRSDGELVLEKAFPPDCYVTVLEETIDACGWKHARTLTCSLTEEEMSKMLEQLTRGNSEGI